MLDSLIEEVQLLLVLQVLMGLVLSAKPENMILDLKQD